MLELFDGFIAAVSTETHIDFKKTKEGSYIAHIEFEGNRKRKVLVYLGKDESEDSTIEYYSQVCKSHVLTSDLYRLALELNVSLTYGALALIEDTLVIHQTTYLKNMDPERFIKSLFYVAAKADELEEMFTKKDCA